MLKKIVLIFAFLITSATISLAAVNSLSIKVTGPDDKPLAEVKVGVEPADGSSEAVFAETDADGAAAFTDLEPGKFIVYINPIGKVSARMPFGRLFYPGAARRAGAVPVELPAAGLTEPIVFKVAKVFPTVSVSGRLIFEDGLPYWGNATKFIFTGAPRDNFDFESQVKTDVIGNFEVKLLRGTSGRIETAFKIDEFALRDCGGLREYAESNLDKSKKDFFVRFASPEFTATENLTGIELKLPFKGCRRKLIV